LIPIFNFTSAGKTISFAGVTVTIKKPMLMGTGSRKMLQRGGGGAGGGGGANEYGATIELDSTEQAIQDTLDGLQSAATTANQAVSNAELLTTFPTDATYADGITPYAGYGGGGN
jgi:hypothetical protein